MDNNNLNETPVQDVQETPVQETPVQNVQETVEQAEQVTYSYTDTAAEEGTTEGGGKALSIVGLILGILSILCCIAPCFNSVLAIVGLILSIVAKKKGAQGLSTGGLITSIAGIVISLIATLVILILVIVGIVNGQ